MQAGVSRALQDGSDEQGVDPHLVSSSWPAPPFLPPPYRALIHPEAPCEFPLRQPLGPPIEVEPLSQGPARREGNVAEEPDDLRDMGQRNRGCVAFPVHNGPRVHSDLLRDSPLRQSKVEATLPQMVS